MMIYVPRGQSDPWSFGGRKIDQPQKGDGAIYGLSRRIGHHQSPLAFGFRYCKNHGLSPQGGSGFKQSRKDSLKRAHPQVKHNKEWGEVLSLHTYLLCEI